MTETPRDPTPASRSLLLRTLTGVVLSCAILTTAAAQTVTPPPDTAVQPTSVAAGIDDDALSRSARASKLIGSDIYSAGERVGKIEDLLIDRERAAVAGAIVSVGGFLGIGEKRIAIPITEIKLGNEAKFTIDMSKDDLKNAPVFDYAKLR